MTIGPVGVIFCHLRSETCQLLLKFEYVNLEPKLNQDFRFLCFLMAYHKIQNILSLQGRYYWDQNYVAKQVCNLVSV